MGGQSKVSKQLFIYKKQTIMITSPEAQPEAYSPVQRVKDLRRQGDNLIQSVKNIATSAETVLAMRKFQEGVMWLGMELKRMGEENPYPSSKDPSTGDKIEPTADNLKF